MKKSIVTMLILISLVGGCASPTVGGAALIGSPGIVGGLIRAGSKSDYIQLPPFDGELLNGNYQEIARCWEWGDRKGVGFYLTVYNDLGVADVSLGGRDSIEGGGGTHIRIVLERVTNISTRMFVYSSNRYKAIALKWAKEIRECSVGLSSKTEN